MGKIFNQFWHWSNEKSSQCTLYLRLIKLSCPSRNPDYDFVSQIRSQLNQLLRTWIVCQLKIKSDVQCVKSRTQYVLSVICEELVTSLIQKLSETYSKEICNVSKAVLAKTFIQNFKFSFLPSHRRHEHSIKKKLKTNYIRLASSDFI